MYYVSKCGLMDVPVEVPGSQYKSPNIIIDCHKIYVIELH